MTLNTDGNRVAKQDKTTGDVLSAPVGPALCVPRQDTLTKTGRGLFVMGSYWRVSLLADGRMGVSQSRAGLIRLALGR